MKHKLLTIAIPHFNQAHDLLETINCLHNQITDDVEVIVSDNGSRKTLSDFEGRIRAAIPKVKIYSNDINLGFDKNVDLCVARSTGTYVWLLGCGDIISPHAVDEVLDCLREFKPKINCVFDVIEIQPTNTSRSRSANAEGKWLNHHENVSLDSVYASALSGNIVKRQAWLKISNEKLQFENWCHVERLFQIFKCSENDTSYKKTLKIRGVEVAIDRSKGGWWSLNDTNFIYNSLLHITVVERYLAALNQKSLLFSKPTFCRYFNLSLPKALLFSATIPQRAEPMQKVRLQKLLKQRPVLYLLYLFLQIVPIRFIQIQYRALKLLAGIISFRKLST